MPDQPTPAPLPSKAEIESDTAEVIAYAREQRGKLPAGDPETLLHLRASGGLAEVLRVEFPGASLGRVLASVSSSLGAIEDHLTAGGFEVAGGLLTVLTLAGEQLDREDAEAGRA